MVIWVLINILYHPSVPLKPQQKKKKGTLIKELIVLVHNARQILAQT